MSDDVRNFVDQDKALCSQALDGDREVLIRAAELMDWAHQQPSAQGRRPVMKGFPGSGAVRWENGEP